MPRARLLALRARREAVVDLLCSPRAPLTLEVGLCDLGSLSPSREIGVVGRGASQGRGGVGFWRLWTCHSSSLVLASSSRFVVSPVPTARGRRDRQHPSHLRLSLARDTSLSARPSRPPSRAAPPPLALARSRRAASPPLRRPLRRSTTRPRRRCRSTSPTRTFCGRRRRVAVACVTRAVSQRSRSGVCSEPSSSGCVIKTPPSRTRTRCASYDLSIAPAHTVERVRA